MKDYPFNFEQLFEFGNSCPYNSWEESVHNLFKDLNKRKEELHFPAIQNDIGSLLSFIFKLYKPKNIFEMGSGYGHSAFWYFVEAISLPEKVILTEKRSDLKEVFENLPWPVQWKEKMDYHQGDAFEKLSSCDLAIDFALIDGVKADYLKFLEVIYPKMVKGGIVAIDNSYWRGSFLDPELKVNKASARNIAKLHEFIKNSNQWDKVFLPYKDGLSLLIKK